MLADLSGVIRSNFRVADDPLGITTAAPLPEVLRGGSGARGLLRQRSKREAPSPHAIGSEHIDESAITPPIAHVFWTS